VKCIYPALAGQLERDGPFALATIIETGGSTPQVPGASALFSERGLTRGTLGGGLLEAEAERRAQAALASRRSALFRFDLRGEGLEDEEPVCGGEASILVDASPAFHLDAFQAMLDSLRARRRGVMVTRVRQSPSGEVGIERRWVEEGAGADAARDWGSPLRVADIDGALSEDRPAVLRAAAGAPERGGFDFLEPLAPLPRLVIAGAGHIGHAVSRLAGPLGFEVMVIDDRAEFASPGRFPDADRFIVDKPGNALRGLPAGGDTYIIIVTRGHRDDADALRACIRSPAAYIGMIGSRSKVSLVREKFLSEGWATAAEFDRVHTPIGLPIGSRTVEEIAVSIAAELVQERSRLRGNPRRGEG
jgi:xanthine dehydrogenase accessory factor